LKAPLNFIFNSSIILNPLITNSINAEELVGVNFRLFIKAGILQSAKPLIKLLN